MEHTKGPWSWDREEDDVWKITSDSGTITSIVQYPDKECNPDRECEATARLIAAAPELIEALKVIADRLTVGPRHSGHLKSVQAIQAVAKAAIAKAEASGE